MTDILTIWVECGNQINRNALSGYQDSDLGETGDDWVHSESCSYPGPGFLITLVKYAAVGDKFEQQERISEQCCTSQSELSHHHSHVN